MRYLSISTCFLFLSILVQAQREIDEKSNPPFQDRVYFGGGLGLSGGTNQYGYRYFYVGLFPMVGYMVNNQFSVGTFASWQHVSYPDNDYQLDQYGLSPFVRYNFQQLFLYSEIMILNSPTSDPGSPRKFYGRWLMGVGFAQPLGKRTALNVMALYDVIYNPGQRVFNSPWVFRLFITF